MKAEKKQTGALISIDLYQRARAQALLEGRTVGEVIDDALLAYLSEKVPTFVRTRPPKRIRR